VKRTEHDPDLAALVKKIARDRGFGFDSYKESCLKRRVAVRMRASGVGSYEEYADLLDRDHGEYERLLDTLTINVTKFYRNRETWDAIARRVLPVLWERRTGHVHCWSAGCSSGEEPYTIGILFSEVARENAASAGSVRIDATDFDRRSLERAGRGVYEEAALEEMPPDLVGRYFSNGSRLTVKPEIRSLVRFLRHDITREAPPAPPYDLIICRNVLIYFDRDTQQRLVSQFIDSLNPDGYLVLGRAETLFGAPRGQLELEDPRERIYRRP
jgi:chemotaxis methyl-accepting protein methylase